MEHSHQTKAASFFVQAFGIIILVISGITTFGFFFNYFPGILPESVAGGFLGALIAGMIGVTLFDLATVYWLNTFLKDAETSSQRAIALLMVVITFLGAASASIAHLGLTAGGELALDAGARDTIANVAIVTVILGVVLNFGANVAYTRFSLENEDRVRESNRRDKVKSAENKQADLLDTKIGSKVEELIALQAPALAQLQAARLVAAFRDKEESKYAEVTGKPLLTPAMSEQPTTEAIAPPFGLTAKPSATDEPQMKTSGDSEKPSIHGGQFPNA